MLFIVLPTKLGSLLDSVSPTVRSSQEPSLNVKSPVDSLINVWQKVEASILYCILGAMLSDQEPLPKGSFVGASALNFTK